jgi:hypothetical protein
MDVLSFHQRKRVAKVYEENYYVVDSNETNSTLSCKLTGSQRHVYEVKIHDGLAKCDCPDGKNNSFRYQTWCKHVCFIVIKVGKITDISVFQSRRLNHENVNRIRIRLDHFLNVELRNMWKNATNHGSFEDKPIDDECSICYENLIQDVVSCPTCRHGFHKLCIETWLRVNTSCVYCRSRAWSQYGLQMNEYVQLNHFNKF